MSSQSNNDSKNVVLTPKTVHKVSFNTVSLSSIIHNKSQVIKLSVVVLLIAIFALCNNLGFGNKLPLTKSDCIIDYGFLNTKFVHEVFNNNDLFRHCIEGIGSIFLDGLFIFSLLNWALFADTWRYGWVLMFFYGIRMVIQQIYQMKFPEEWFWDDPGVPSIVVGYLRTNDFFFSGHVGMPTINAFEFKWQKKYYLSAFCFFVAFYEGFLVLISRVHYSIDIVIGFFFAHYSLIMTEYILQEFRRIVKKYSKNSENESKNVEEKTRDYMLNDNIENIDIPTSGSEEGKDK